MKQLNIKPRQGGPDVHGIAEELSSTMDVTMNRVVELLLVAALTRMRRYIEDGGDPALFVAQLKIEGRDQPRQRRDDGAEEVS